MTYIDRTLDVIVNAGIVIILLSPLPYGAVEPWSVVVFQITSFIILASWFAGNILKGEIRMKTPGFYLPLAVLALILILQLLPLPVFAIKIISPRTAELWQNATNSVRHIWENELLRSYTLSINPFVSKQKILLYLSYLSFFIVVSNTVSTRKQIKKYLFFLIVLAAVEAIIGIAQYLLTAGSIPASGTYVNKNHFAGLLAMIIPAALGYLFYLESRATSETRRWETLLRHKFSDQLMVLFIICIIGLSMILSQSRGAIASSVISISVLYVLSSRTGRVKINAWFIRIFLAMVIIYALWIGLNPVIDRFSRSAAEITLRTSIWKDTVNIVKDYPVFGTGLGTYSLSYTMYKDNVNWPTVIQHAHNDYLQMLVEFGIAGFIAVVWWLVTIYVRAYRIIKTYDSKLDRFRYYMLSGFICGTISMLIHASIEFPFQIPSNAYYFAFLLGISKSIMDRMSSTQAIPESGTRKL